MKGSLKSLALGILLLGGCRENDMTPPPADLSTAIGGADLSVADMAAGMATTIRALNSGTVMDNTPVKVTGVVISPFTYINVRNATSGGMTVVNCDYTIYIAQPDQSPTTKDGLTVYYSKTEAAPDMGLNVTRCRELGKDYDILKDLGGNTVEVSGTFQSSNGYRQLFLRAGNGITDKGKAAMAPIPAVAAPGDFATLDQLKAGRGALIQFKDVTTTMAEAAFPFRFSVTANGGTARIGSDYLRPVVMNYMPPKDGTTLSSLIGVVVTDFGGSIWPRTAADVTPTM